MPKITYNALSDTSILNSKTSQKQYKIFDGQGLFVLIHPNGSKYFRYRYKLEGKDKLIICYELEGKAYPETFEGKRPGMVLITYTRKKAG